MIKKQLIFLLFLIIISCTTGDNEVIEYYNSGAVKKISYYDGDKKIKDEKFEENGLKRESTEYNYKEADTLITFIYYHSSGNVNFKKESINDKELEVTFYDDQGRKIWRDELINDRWYFWYKSGALESECDNTNGKFISYYEDGTTKETGNVKNYLRDSIWTFYSPAGELVQEILYDQDKVIEKKVYDQAVVDSLFSDEY